MFPQALTLQLTGSHLMVLTEQAQAAAREANKKYLQDEGNDMRVLHSIGPLPAYPIVVNSRLDSEYNDCW
jgi:ABC-type phosphate/phosphonate transport system substrate-binding protein